MKLPTLLLLLACEIGAPGPAPAGSPAATEVAAVSDIAAQAAKVEETAHALTSLVDESRRQVADGRSTPAAEIEKMRALMAQLDAQNQQLQADIAALEARTRTAAGDPAPPTEPEKRR
jgi:peptidoglycan hydrolase CwlO-like protein